MGQEVIAKPGRPMTVSALSIGQRFWRRWRLVFRELFSHSLLIPLAIIFMIPFFWMVSTSLKPKAQIFTKS